MEQAVLGVQVEELEDFGSVSIFLRFSSAHVSAALWPSERRARALWNFSTQLSGQLAGHSGFCLLQAWLTARVAAPTVETLAGQFEASVVTGTKR